MTVHWVDHLPGNRWAVTDGERIWMLKSLSQAERRTTLTHELEHIDTGLLAAQSSKVEAQLHRSVARKMIPIDMLLAALAWAHSVDELAEECHVDVDTMMARLDSITSDELHDVIEVLEARNWGA